MSERSGRDLANFGIIPVKWVTIAPDWAVLTSAQTLHHVVSA
jgi:hypothetical protein